ncbi:MAG TPA: hypothetical protein VN578_01570 [Candidatus Binatia bacterium]|nr:hypothetical protein [Candidatus Binatia bacterium]
MKTPREVLLAQHRAIQPKLDRMREELLKSEMRNAKSEWNPDFRFGLVSAAATVWRRLIWPSRRVWAGLAAVWVLLLLINLSDGKPASLYPHAASGPAVVQALVEQKQLLAELLQASQPTPAERPRPTPRPRSERALDWRAC